MGGSLRDKWGNEERRAFDGISGGRIPGRTVMDTSSEERYIEWRRSLFIYRRKPKEKS